MRGRILSLLTLLAVGCVSTITTYSIDEQGNPVVKVENHNLIRVGATAQVTTYNPETMTVAISQVLAADSMSDNLTKAWSRLMDVAGYAILGAGVSAAAGGPTTPAAVAGGLVGYIKSKVTEEDEEPEEETP